MFPNINAGMGAVMANALNFNPTTGRIYVVAKSGVANEQEIRGMLGATMYPAGVLMVFQTVKLAVAQCRANAGDVILIVPGHTEVITNATDLAINVAGVRVIGLGQGTDRPTFTFTTSTAATIAISAANVLLQNVVCDMTGGIASLAAMVTVTAAGVTIINNQITTSVANNAVLGISATAAANNLLIVNNFFSGIAASTTTAAIQLVGGNDIAIRNNVFTSGYGAAVGAISNITTAVTRLTIDGNYINNQTAVSTVAISAVAGTTGVVANNRMQILSLTAPIVAVGMSWVGGNYYAATIATAGTLI